MVNLQAGELRGTVAMSAPSLRHGGATKEKRDGMGGSSSYGLGRGDTAARRGLLSAASSSSPAGRGRGHDQGREGTAARRR